MKFCTYGWTVMIFATDIHVPEDELRYTNFDDPPPNKSSDKILVEKCLIVITF